MYNRYLPREDFPDPSCADDREQKSFLRFLPGIWEKLKPDRLDKGDLLLAAVLFLLYSDSGEEEYLFALVLLFLL